jgi:hypothetical protein
MACPDGPVNILSQLWTLFNPRAFRACKQKLNQSSETTPLRCMASSPLFATYISRAIYYTNFRKALVDEKKISGRKSCDNVTGVSN